VAYLSKHFALVPAVAVAFASLAACDKGQEAGGDAPTATASAAKAQLFPDDFKGACSGAGLSRAAAYDPAKTPHKAVYFESWKDDLTDRSTSLPPDWTVQFTADGDAYAAVDLVACGKRTASKEVKVCDGYKSDDKPTNNKVRWHTATYQLTVYEAKTGKKLGETSVEATNQDCPMFQNFDGDNQTVDGYASVPDSTVAEFLKTHIAG
jgi:hypothetical protein